MIQHDNKKDTPLATPATTQMPWQYPTIGGNPGSTPATTPGSFAKAAEILPAARGALTFSSPDTPGMPGFY